MEGPDKKPRKRLYVTLVILIALLVLGAAFYWWAGSSSRAAISPEQPSITQQKAVTMDTFKGKYIEFRYSSEYLVKTLTSSPPDLENYMFSADTTYNKRIAVSVSQLPGGNLNEDSAYNLRVSDTKDYSSYTQTVDGTKASVWTKKDGTEETAFIVKGNLVAMLSFSTVGGQTNLQPEVTNVLGSFHWLS